MCLFDMFKISAFSDEVFDSLLDQINFLTNNNIKYIELRSINKENIINIKDDLLYEYSSLLKQYGIKVSAIASPIGKSDIIDDFNSFYTSLERAINVAAIFKTRLIRIFSFYNNHNIPEEEYRRNVIARLKKATELASENNIILVHENEKDIYGHSAVNCLDLVENINSDYFKLAYDPGNFVWNESISDNVDTCYKLLKKQVAHVHIKDWKIGQVVSGEIPGRGDAQIKKLLLNLHNDGYNGFLTLEPHLGKGLHSGGVTSSEHFILAVDALKKMCNDFNINFK